MKNVIKIENIIMMKSIIKGTGKNPIVVATIEQDDCGYGICRIKNGEPTNIDLYLKRKGQVIFMEDWLASMSVKKLTSENWKKIILKLNRISYDGYLLKKDMIVKYWHKTHENGFNLKIPEYRTLYRIGAFCKDNKFELIPLYDNVEKMKALPMQLVPVKNLEVINNSLDAYKYITLERLRMRDDLKVYNLLAGKIFEIIKISFRHGMTIAVPKKISMYESLILRSMYVEKINLIKKVF